MGCLSSLILLRQCCEGFTCLFIRNDIDETGCLLALLFRQCCEGFICLITRLDLNARCFTFGIALAPINDAPCRTNAPCKTNASCRMNASCRTNVPAMQ
jgi:hypothetical protein